MTTRHIETPYFPLVVEVDDDFIGNVMVTHKDEIARQLRVIIAKSPNPKTIDYAKKMLMELDNAR